MKATFFCWLSCEFCQVYIALLGRGDCGAAGAWLGFMKSSTNQALPKAIRISYLHFETTFLGWLLFGKCKYAVHSPPPSLPLSPHLSFYSLLVIYHICSWHFLFIWLSTFSHSTICWYALIGFCTCAFIERWTPNVIVMLNSSNNNNNNNYHWKIIINCIFIWP